MRRPDEPSRPGRPGDPPRDPLRLFEDPGAPPVLADALRAVRGRTPDEQQMSKLAAALGLALPLPLPLPPPAIPPASAAGPAAGATAGAATGAGAAAGVKLAVAGLAAAGAIAVATVGIGGHGGGLSLRPAPAPVVQKAEPRAPEPAEENFFATDPTLPAPPATGDPVVPAHRRHVARPLTAPAAETPPPEAALDAASRLREEASLVQRAERLLTSDPGTALRLTEERKRRFPNGALDQEAEVVAIDALLRLGRRPAAAARAQAFEAAHAGSIHARRVKRLLGD